MANENLPSFDEMPDPQNPAPEPEETTEAAATSEPQVQQVPYPVPVPVQDPNANAFAQWQAAQERQAYERQNAEYWNQVLTPPAIPDDPDDLLTDGEKLKKTLQDTQAWARNAVGALLAPQQQRIAQLEGTLYASTVRHAEYAFDKARARLHQEGIPEDPNVWQQVERLMQGNPQTYWQLRTDANTMAKAYKMVRDEMTSQGYSAPVAQAQRPPATAAGTGFAPRNVPGAPIELDEHLAKVQAKLGIRFTAEDLKDYRNVGEA